MQNKLEIFVNETQFVDWENQIVEVNISYNIYGKIYKMTLLAEDESELIKIGYLVQSLYNLNDVWELSYTLEHITQMDTSDY